MRITGSGALNLDIIYQVPDLGEMEANGLTLEPGRETWGTYEQAQKLMEDLEKRGRLLARSGGGSSANTICALAAMGFDCMFLGSVGEDEDGTFLLESMKGVDCSLVSRSGQSSICIIVLEEETRDRAMFVAPGPFSLDASSKELAEALARTGLFHMTSLVQEEGTLAQERLLALLDPGAMVTFDPGEIYASRGKKAIRNLLGQTDILFSTDYEMQLLFGIRDEQDILMQELRTHRKQASLGQRFFRELSSPIIAKKMGSRGAALYSSRGNYFCPAKRVDDIVDNTGAGDAFNAGLLAAILKGQGASRAIKEAVGLAAFSLGFPGRSWIDQLWN